MKYLLVSVLIATRVPAQFIVHDPVNTAVNTAVQVGQAANHLEIMAQWAQQLEHLNRQLRQLEEQLAVQKRIQTVMGDPSAADVGGILNQLGSGDLAHDYGETLSSIRRLANAVESLRQTADGIYRRIEDRTSLHRDFARSPDLYLRFAAIERQAENVSAVQTETAAKTNTLQNEVADTVTRLRDAGTQAEVDKLHATLVALNGQVLHLDAVRQAENEKLRALQILNENQAAKERQDLLEKQLAEERQTVDIVNTWQASVKVVPSSYRD